MLRGVKSKKDKGGLWGFYGLKMRTYDSQSIKNRILIALRK